MAEHSPTSPPEGPKGKKQHFDFDSLIASKLEYDKKPTEGQQSSTKPENIPGTGIHEPNAKEVRASPETQQSSTKPENIPGTSTEETNPKAAQARPGIKKSALRKKKNFDLKPLENFSGTMLPTNQEVLCRLFYLQEKYSGQGKTRTIRSMAEEILEELQEIYQKVPCEMIIKRNGLDKICKLHKSYKTAVKNKESSKRLADQIRLKDFKLKLHQICDLIGAKAIVNIQKSGYLTEKEKIDDINFLLDQRSHRKMRFGPVDKKYITESLLDEAEDHDNDLENVEESDQEIDSDSMDEDDEDDEEDDEDFKLPVSHQKKSTSEEDVTELKVQLKMMKEKAKKAKNLVKDSKLLSTLDRTKTSDRSAMRIVSSAANALGADLGDMNISRETIRRARIDNRAQVYQQQIEAFASICPKRAVVHFDGKMLSDLSGDFGDRLAVMISGNTDYCRQGKLLSAELVPDQTGIGQANEVIRSLQEWKCQDNVVGMCFDTCSTNTGKRCFNI